MYSLAIRSTLGLVAAALLFAPSAANAQYVVNQPSVGVAVGTPNFGLNLAFGQPVYRPAPVVVYPAYPVYGPVVPPYAAPYRNYYPNYGPAPGFYHNGHYHYGNSYNGNYRGYRR